MTPERRKLIQDVYIRICRDGRFAFDMVDAARLAARVFEGHPLDVWLALGMNNMERIANGTHPVVPTATNRCGISIRMSNEIDKALAFDMCVERSALARELEAALRDVVRAGRWHIETNGESVVGRDGRQRITIGMIKADHALVEAMNAADAVLAKCGNNPPLVERLRPEHPNGETK